MAQESETTFASGLLLSLLGFWLLMQTVIGDLPRRLLSWAMTSGGGSGPLSNVNPLPILIPGLAPGAIINDLSTVVSPGTAAGSPTSSPFAAASTPSAN